MTIRTLDEHEILDALNLCRELFFVTVNPEYDLQKTKDYEAYLAREKEKCLYLGIYSQELEAMIAYYPSNFHIACIAHRQKEAALQLFALYCNMARKEGIGSFTLEIPAVAKDYYETEGFTFVAEVKEGSLSFVRMEYLLGREYLGQKVHVTIDHPYGSIHPHYPDVLFPVNYGYVDETEFLDGSFQNAYVVGLEEPRESVYGTVIAQIYRSSGEVIYVVSPNEKYQRQDVINDIGTLEQYYDTQIIWL